MRPFLISVLQIRLVAAGAEALAKRLPVFVHALVCQLGVPPPSFIALGTHAATVVLPVVVSTYICKLGFRLNLALIEIIECQLICLLTRFGGFL